MQFFREGGYVNEKKGSRKRRYKLGKEYWLSIIEQKGVARWYIVDKKGTNIKTISDCPEFKLILIPGALWSIHRDNGVGIIIYGDYKDFNDPTICLLFLFHEIGHLLNWSRFTNKQIKNDERCAWAFALREMRRLEKDLDVKLLTLKRFRDIQKKIHRWINNYKKTN